MKLFMKEVMNTLKAKPDNPITDVVFIEIRFWSLILNHGIPTLTESDLFV